MHTMPVVFKLIDDLIDLAAFKLSQEEQKITVYLKMCVFRGT